MLNCEDCGLRYEIIWNNDGISWDEYFCPRCGSQEISEDEEEA